MNERDENGTIAPSAAFGDQPREGGFPSALPQGLAEARALLDAPTEGGLPPAPCRPSRLRLSLLFVMALLASFYLHEIGHCAVAWVRGCPAIPTPLKEYILEPLSAPVRNAVSLGGIAGSVIALFLALGWFLRRPGPTRSPILAGAMTAPGFYTLRFSLAGRGHDATEFQEAQVAMGLEYAEHALDWVFVGLFVGATALWFWRARPPLTLRLAGRLAAGALAALVAVCLLQSVNNAVFDPLFEPPPAQAGG